MANGKHKGGAFEREVCKLLSLWWTNDERDDVFYRSASSGGRATARSRRGKNTANSHGDIMAVDPIGQPLIDLICFEIKRGYNRCTIHDLIDRPDHAAKQEWEKWIEQAEESCKGAGSYSWAIIHQRDRRDPIISMPQKLVKLFSYRGPNVTSDLKIGVGCLEMVSMNFNTSFLNTVSPSELKYAAERVV